MKIVLNYFQNIDVEKLLQNLKEECSYQNTIKIDFFNEVARIFDSLRNSVGKYHKIYIINAMLLKKSI
jgi:hypothetical protein